MIDKDKLNYLALIKNYPWIIIQNQNAIISPDVDGLLCGLLLSNYLKWKIIGFYDGKELAINKSFNINHCIIVDIEIFRKDIKSCGHHMLIYNKKNISEVFQNFQNCINPNNIRNLDSKSDFKRKYPFAMIHFLLCIMGNFKEIKIDEKAIPPLLYVDGTFKNLLNYPENRIEWLNFFDAKNKNSPLYEIYVLFANRKIYQIMHEMENIFKSFKKISSSKRGGDKIKISEIYDGNFGPEYLKRIISLLELLSHLTNWRFLIDKWILKDFTKFVFKKEIKNNINNKIFNDIIEEQPISWAITATKRIEYTIGKIT
jgi:hypothetical protein